LRKKTPNSVRGWQLSDVWRDSAKTRESRQIWLILVSHAFIMRLKRPKKIRKKSRFALYRGQFWRFSCWKDRKFFSLYRGSTVYAEFPKKVAKNAWSPWFFSWETKLIFSFNFCIDLTSKFSLIALFSYWIQWKIWQ
jgi:hypothetical protein